MEKYVRCFIISILVRETKRIEFSNKALMIIQLQILQKGQGKIIVEEVLRQSLIIRLTLLQRRFIAESILLMVPN